jgi:hypothetical protein
MDTEKFFVYDPTRQGYDTDVVWTTLTGTPSESGGNLDFNEASAIQNQDLLKGVLKMRVTVPTEPTEGDAREWGFHMPSTSSSILFEVDDEIFSAVVTDGKTDATERVEIAWNEDWTDAPVDFEIRWRAGMADFIADGTRKATIAFSPEGMSLAMTPMSIYVGNENEDGLLVRFIEFTGM